MAGLEQQSSAELQQAFQQLQSVQDMIKKANTEKEAALKQCKALEKQLAEQGAAGGTAESADKIKQLEEENQLILEQLFKVQEELERQYLQAKSAQTSNPALEQQLQELKESDAHKAREIERKNEKLHTFSQKMKWLRGKVEKAEADRDHAQAQLGELEASNNRLEKELSSSDKQLESTLRELNEVKLELDNATGNSKELDELKETVKRLESRIDGKQKVIDRKDEKLHTFSQKIKKLQAELEAKPAMVGQPLATPVVPAQPTTEQPTKRKKSPFSVLNRLGRNKVAQNSSQEQQNVELLKRSPLFDATWYLQQYPDVAVSGTDAATHYLRFGGFEGRNPSEHFDSAWYLEQNQDVKNAHINPLLHFLMFGHAEGRAAKA